MPKSLVTFPLHLGLGATAIPQPAFTGDGAEHRLVYRCKGTGSDQRLEVVQCRDHY